MKLLSGSLLLFAQTSNGSPAKEELTRTESSEFLSRRARGYHILEETKQGNFERECIEEDCNQEECLEVSDDLLVYGRMWKALGECQKDPNAARDYIRRCTQKLFQAKWEEWSEWTQCAASCHTLNQKPPKRARRRSCNVGVYGEDCSPAGTTTEMEDCLDLPYCKVMNLQLTKGRLRNALDATFEANWNDVKGFDKDKFQLRWRINDEMMGNYNLQKGVTLYHNAEYGGRVRITAEILDDFPSSEFVLAGPLTEKDKNGTVTLELYWDQFQEQETRNIGDLIE